MIDICKSNFRYLEIELQISIIHCRSVCKRIIDIHNNLHISLTLFTTETELQIIVINCNLFTNICKYRNRLAILQCNSK